MNQARKPAPGRRKPAAPANQVYYHRNEAVVIPEGYLAIGRITTAHGIHGEVRVEPHTDFPERFAPELTLYIGEALDEAIIEYARPHKQQILVKLVEVETRDDAEALRGEWLFVPEEEAIALEPDSYWVHDIVGLYVYTEAGQALGVISEVLFTGANEVYVIQRADTGTELLVPAIADVVQTVDVANKRMVVRLLPGLLDEAQ
ncbi:MAG: ribosome maturation factor RimM [Caldilineaceae bacterium]|nr:ribosome maturation factor RimM [Caldilineaceae bacterium]